MTTPYVPFSLTQLHVWSERDRNHVELRDSRNDKTIVEWWDEDAIQAVEDGFLPCIAETPTVHTAAYEYARSVEMLPTFKRIETSWSLRTYDVWGNRKDGYEVNDSYSAGCRDLILRVELNNAGTPHEFVSASPSDYQIQSAFGVRCRLDTDGDDTHIYVNRASDGYPIGEMTCTSHDSLSPIRP